MPQLLFSIVKTSMLLKNKLLPHILLWRKSLYMFMHTFQIDTWGFFIKYYSQETQMIGTAMFHQGLQQKGSSLSYPVLVDEKYWYYSPSAISMKQSLSEKQQWQHLCWSSWLHVFVLKVSVTAAASQYVWNRETERDREILSSVL